MDHCHVKWALIALERDTSYVPRVKQPLQTDTLHALVESLPEDPEGIIVRVAVLTMY